MNELDRGYSLLHYAVENGNVEDILLLFDKGINPNIQDIFGNTALLFLLMGDNIDLSILLLLLNKGVDPNICNNVGIYPLYYSIFELENREIATILIENGADTNKYTSDGTSTIAEDILIYYPKYRDLLFL